MKKYNHTLLFIIFTFSLPPLLIGCVAEKDLSALNIKMRTMDSRLIDLERNLDGFKRSPDSSPRGSVDSMQRQQAELSDLTDRLKAEVLQLKGQIEENTHYSQQMRQENQKPIKDLYAKLEELDNTVKALQGRMDGTESKLGDSSAEMKAFLDSRTREAAEKAAAAAHAAREAEQKAAAAAAPAGGQRTLKPEKEKKKSDDDEQPAAAQEEPGQEIYNKALQSYKENNFKEAEGLFDSFIKKHAKSSNVPNAFYWKADSLYNLGNYDNAILEYQKVITDYPRHNKVPAALLKQGLSFEKLKDKETAKIIYQKIISEYPKSEQIESAKKRLAALQ